MDQINLIPKHRRLARQRYNCIRVWTAAVIGYSLLVLIGCLFYRGLSVSYNIDTMHHDISDYQLTLAELKQKQDSIRPELKEQQLILSAGRSITDQPDWSLLLTYLADEVLGDNVVLAECSLAPDDKQQDALEVNKTPLVLTLSGYAQTAPDMSKFVLRLEEMGLFERVKLTRTNREPFLKTQAITFEVKCSMPPANGGGS